MEKNRCPRLMVAAPKSGSGKTMVTCGLLQAFKNRGLQCRAFKCGPDYIDPMFHKSVLEIEGGNIDTYFLPEDEAGALFWSMAQGADLAVIEGVMGFYDGVGGISTQASAYDVACVTDTPVVLILDCKGASLSLAAVVKGFLEFREDSHIRGVILNRISPMMADRLIPEIEKTGVKVYGCLPECQAATITSRHLGLTLPGELQRLREQMQELAEEVEKRVDVEGLIELAEEYAGGPEVTGENAVAPEPMGESAVAPEPMGESARKPDPSREYTDSSNLPVTHPGRSASAFSPSRPVRIAVALDDAFCFYYQENLKLLEQLGAELAAFSPIRDPELPKGCAGLLLGGGYPELHAAELSANSSMLHSVKNRIARGMPVLAECGGFLYLHEELETEEGKIFPMAGVIPARGYPTGKLSRFGYVELTPYENTKFLKKGESIRGHEFHYWDSTDCGNGMEAVKPQSTRKWDCMHAENNLLAGFPHLYYPSNPELIRRWLTACREWERQHTGADQEE